MCGAGFAHVGSSNSRENIFGIGNHMHAAERMPALVDASHPAFLMTSHGSNDSSSRVPLKVRLRPWTLMTQSVVAERYGKMFPFLVKGDFGFVEKSDFCVSGNQVLNYVYRPRVERTGKPEGTGTRSIKQDNHHRLMKQENVE